MSEYNYELGNDGNEAQASQESQLDEQQLEEIIREAEQEGTKMATKWAMKKFSNWLEKRSINIILSTAPSQKLAKVLQRFYAESKAEKTGQALSPSTLIGLRAGIQRGLLEIRTDEVNIVRDVAFSKANKMLAAKCRTYAKNGNPPVQHKEAIAEEDLRKVEEYFSDQETLQDPRRLQQAIWFIIAYNLGCRGRELYRQIRKDSVKIVKDDTQQSFVCIEQSATEKNHQGSSASDQGRIDRGRIYESAFGCATITELFSLYMDKLNPESPWFFQTPKAATHAGEPWYKKEPVGINTIGKIMPKISAAASLSKTYTNHCVRATTITVLFRGGVRPQSIMARTGHRTLQGLNPYISKSTPAQQRQEANTLAAAMGAGPGMVARQEAAPVVAAGLEVAAGSVAADLRAAAGPMTAGAGEVAGLAQQVM